MQTIVTAGAPVLVNGGAAGLGTVIAASGSATTTFDTGAAFLPSDRVAPLPGKLYDGLTWRLVCMPIYTTTAVRTFTVRYTYDYAGVSGNVITSHAAASLLATNRKSLIEAWFTVRGGGTQIFVTSRLDFGGGIVLADSGVVALAGSNYTNLGLFIDCSAALVTETLAFRHTLWEQLQ